jgi:hypothetical protein
MTTTDVRADERAVSAPPPAAPPVDVREALEEMRTRKNAAYNERNKVVAALARLFPSGVARTCIEGWSEDWHGCVYIDLPTGQVSWHFHDSQAPLFAGLPPYSGVWDGHDTDEKYRRLAALAAAPIHPSPVPAAADVMVGLSAWLRSLAAIGGDRSALATMRAWADEVDSARAALAAPPLMEPAPPVGWKLVPLEPTREMAIAAVKCRYGAATYKNVSDLGTSSCECEAGDDYRAMLAASPVPADREPVTDLDAELGRTAMLFVDRAGDVAPGIDDAETICAEFHAAMLAVLDKHPPSKDGEPVTIPRLTANEVTAHWQNMTDNYKVGATFHVHEVAEAIQRATLARVAHALGRALVLGDSL